MNRSLPLLTAIATFVAPSAAFAQSPAEPNGFQVVELREFTGGAEFVAAQQELYDKLLVSAVEAGGDGAFPMQVAFDGQFEFLKTSRRLRIWRPEVSYSLTVNAQGKVTDCEITESFRRAYVNQKLCEVLTKHHQFEPMGNSVAEQGAEQEYTSKLVYMDMREELEANR
ncbi:MAG: hypothetical protein AAGL10_01045 [Pseudomonadota bacterium]